MTEIVKFPIGDDVDIEMTEQQATDYLNESGLEARSNPVEAIRKLIEIIKDIAS